MVITFFYGRRLALFYLCKFESLALIASACSNNSAAMIAIPQLL